MPLIRFLAALSIVTILPVHAARTITSLTAGNGDGGQATSTALNFVQGMAYDSAGNLYVSDRNDLVVRRITPSGVISTYAGTGYSYSVVSGPSNGDGGPANAARLNSPAGLAFDPAGNLYIAEEGAHRIRKVTPSGVISTFAGTGVGSFSGDNGPATAAMLLRPSYVATDAAGNVYIADTGNWRIRRVNTAGVITTFAGGVTSGFTGDGGPATAASISAPRGLAFDGAGNLYIADFGYNRIRRVTPAGIISTIAGDGSLTYTNGSLATATGVGRPVAITFDSAGRLLLTMQVRGAIYRVNANGIIEQIAGLPGAGTNGNAGDGGQATAAAIGSIHSLLSDANGNLLLSTNDRVRRIAGNGIISTIVGGFLGDGGAASAARLVSPSSIVADASGNLLVETAGSLIRRIGGGTVSTFAGNNLTGLPPADGSSVTASPGLTGPLAYDRDGNLYAAGWGRIYRITPAGILTAIAGNGTFGTTGDGGAATAAALGVIGGIAIDATGNVFFGEDNRVRRVSTNGILSTVAGTGTAGFSGDGGPGTAAQLSRPVGLAFDRNGDLIIADSNNSRIRRLTPAGVITTMAGSSVQGFAGDNGPATSARLSGPQGITIDSAGNLYIADSFNQRVRRVTPAGVITTYAGSGPEDLFGAFSGDGGPATEARFSYPTGVAVDAAGNLYITDFGNSRIRKVTPDVDPILTNFASVPSGLQITVNGVAYTTPNALPLAPGSVVSIGAATQGNSNVRNVFTSWSDGGAATHNITIGSTTATYTATFTTQYGLLQFPPVGGTLTVTPASPDGFYNAGTVVELAATPNNGQSFLSFTGATTATTTPTSLTMDGPKQVGAQFRCRVILSATSANVGAAAGSLNFTYAPPPGFSCSPVTQTNDPWISFNAAGPFMTFNYTANTGPARSTVILVGAERFTVNQAAGAMPSATDSGPIAGTGANQSLTFRFSHPGGFGQLGVLNILINRALDGGNACYIAYSQPAGVLFLVNDGGPDAGLSAPLVLGSASTVSNSQCTIRGTGSSATGSGNNFALTLNMSFSASFTGSRVVYTAARDAGTGNSGWKTLGNLQIPEASPTFPRTGPMSPATVNASSQTVTVTFQDASSTANIVTGWMLINTALDARNACYVAYFAPANLIFLYPDDGNGNNAITMPLTGSNTVENSQCRINSQGSSTTTTGGLLTLNLNVTTKTPFAGARGIWTAMQTTAPVVSPWRIVGSWLVP